MADGNCNFILTNLTTYSPSNSQECTKLTNLNNDCWEMAQNAADRHWSLCVG